jgi:hypothetical protein
LGILLLLKFVIKPANKIKTGKIQGVLKKYIDMMVAVIKIIQVILFFRENLPALTIENNKNPTVIGLIKLNISVLKKKLFGFEMSKTKQNMKNDAGNIQMIKVKTDKKRPPLL